MALPKLALFIALSAPLLLSPAYAQRGGGGHGGGGGHAVGGGFRGGFSGGAVVGGGFRGGFYGGRGYFYGGRFYGPSIYFGLGGWGYPYYYGYPYYSGYPYYPYDPYYSYDPYTYGGPAYSTPPAPAPQNYGYPPPQGQRQPPPPQQPQTQPQSSNGNQAQNYWLIAFTDHTIQAATAYKVEGDQFHWITREGREMQVPLSRVDIPYSQQLNRDRNVDLQIP